MGAGKIISLFLIDGTVDGVVACELFNWTGKGYKIPRPQLKSVSDRDELKKAGVYFLIGQSDSGEPMVYIGEAEEIYKRLTQHQSKEFWTEAIAIISKDENLNKAHVKYLEYELYKQALAVGRYVLANDNTPNKPAISEAERAVMLEFSANLQIMTGTLGYKIFEPLTNNKNDKSRAYQIIAPRGAEAKGVPTNEGFVVLKGSKIAATDVPSIPVAVKNKRAKLIVDGAIVDFVVAKDILFTSPSLAAAVVLGRSANGLIEWKQKDGSTLKEMQAPDPDLSV